MKRIMIKGFITSFVLSAALVAGVVFVSCGSASVNTSEAAGKASGVAKNAKRVEYKVADHYFLRNDAVIPDSCKNRDTQMAVLKVTEQSQFDSLFGCAPVMGKNGAPTEINFNKEFVLALVLPETNRPTEISPKTIECRGDSLIVSYSCTVGEASTWTMKPLSMLIVDKDYDRPHIVAIQ